MLDEISHTFQKDFPAMTAIFKALNFYFEIQGLSRRVRTLSNAYYGLSQCNTWLRLLYFLKIKSLPWYKVLNNVIEELSILT